MDMGRVKSYGNVTHQIAGSISRGCYVNGVVNIIRNGGRLFELSGDSLPSLSIPISKWSEKRSLIINQSFVSLRKVHRSSLGHSEAGQTTEDSQYSLHRWLHLADASLTEKCFYWSCRLYAPSVSNCKPIKLDWFWIIIGCCDENGPIDCPKKKKKK